MASSSQQCLLQTILTFLISTIGPFLPYFVVKRVVEIGRRKIDEEDAKLPAQEGRRKMEDAVTRLDDLLRWQGKNFVL